MIAEDTICITKFFHCRPQDIFDAWIQPGKAARWFTGSDESVTDVKADMTVGGSFSFRKKENDIMIDYTGSYIEINPPHHLTLSLEVPRHFSGTMYISVFIAEKTNGAELSITQKGGTHRKTAEKWRQRLQQLEMVLMTPGQDN